jgi:hypothetical protein
MPSPGIQEYGACVSIRQHTSAYVSILQPSPGIQEYGICAKRLFRALFRALCRALFKALFKALIKALFKDLFKALFTSRERASAFLSSLRACVSYVLK